MATVFFTLYVAAFNHLDNELLDASEQTVIYILQIRIFVLKLRRSMTTSKQRILKKIVFCLLFSVIFRYVSSLGYGELILVLWFSSDDKHLRVDIAPALHF